MSRKQKTSEKKLLIEFARMIAAKKTSTKGIIVGVGDDTAVVRPDPNEDVLVTTDILVENRHFKRRWFTGYELGWRLAAVNLSDIASMGGRPLYGILSLALPEGLAIDYVRGIERGVRDHLARYDAAIVGGNVSGIEATLVCDLTLIGACKKGQAWRRTCQPGRDAIVVAGYLGQARAGLDLLEKTSRARGLGHREKTTRAAGIDRPGKPTRSAGIDLSGKSTRSAGPLVRAYKNPVPRFDVVRLLAADRAIRGGSDRAVEKAIHGGGSDRAVGKAIHGAIDVSDGFSTDLIHICEAAGAGCEVDPRALPVSPALRLHCRREKKDPLAMALHAGEDYALILAVDPKQATSVVVRIEQGLGIPARIVGRFTKHTGRYLLVQDGSSTPFSSSGWDHLLSRS
jgi:thiamine-monophosphate kinase